MGSLNYNGSRITTTNYILRNIGASVTFNINRQENLTDMTPSNITLQSQRGTVQDRTRTQDTFVNLGSRLKITNSIEDELIERQLTH